MKIGPTVPDQKTQLTNRVVVNAVKHEQNRKKTTDSIGEEKAVC